MHAEPLAADHRVGNEELGERRVLDDRADLAMDEIRGGAVGFAAGGDVGERAEIADPAFAPPLLILAVARFLADLER
jgi:hypothetical protein